MEDLAPHFGSRFDGLVRQYLAGHDPVVGLQPRGDMQRAEGRSIGFDCLSKRYRVQMFSRGSVNSYPIWTLRNNAASLTPAFAFTFSRGWLHSFRGQQMHNPCIDLYPVEAVAAHHNPYSHPRIEQRRMRTKLLLGVFRRHQLSRSHITPIRVALSSLLQHKHQAARSSAP